MAVSNSYAVWGFVGQAAMVLGITLIGWVIARLVRRLVMSVFDVVRFSKIATDTPLEPYIHHPELLERVRQTCGAAAFWLVLLITLQTVVGMLGITALAIWLDRLFSVIPRILSALFVLVLGVIAAGLVESLIKAATRSIDAQWSRLLAKVMSYLVMVAVVLIAIAELGIASNFILILFIGIVFALALAFGLAVGFGAREVVAALLWDWAMSERPELAKTESQPTPIHTKSARSARAK